jgi:DNA helicase-2/ATP-dependent DNA helicase PcrA
MTDSIDYREHLNAPQHEAVTAPEGPVLVIAGAGSGKTRTIVYRVAWLVDRGVPPDSLLLMTFTRKAATEMLTRAAELLDNRVHMVAGGTFHSTGNRLLRKYAKLLGFESTFAIMDQGDMIDAIDLCRKSLHPPPKDLKRFPKARTIASVLSHAVGTDISVADSLRLRFPHLESYAQEIDRVRILYENHKDQNSLMDYDDLLKNTILLLEEFDAVRAEVSHTWKYILVDEYQDTNILQARMLKLLASEHNNVMAVGDDSQSVYSFRGANFRNIMDFPSMFPDTKIIKLEENYRSTGQVLTVTNSIIAGASEGYPKRLFSRQASGPLPLKTRPYTERDQSQFVSQCIKELTEAGIPLKEIAVLFRASFHSFDLEGELTRSHIPFVKYGGFKFLESLHIKDVLAHMKVLDNPKDRLSWSRVLKILPGIGPKTALDLADKIAANGIPKDVSELVTGKRKYSEKLQELIDLLGSLRDEPNPIADKVDKVSTYYYPFLKENYDNYPKRMRDLEHLADLTTSYRSMNRFLNEMALEPPDADFGDTRPTGDSVVLSTIHSAKGLEWHTVIVIWAVEGRIPSPMADEEGGMEEERRLLYVAATRAKHNLVVVSPMTVLQRRMGSVPARLSRFLEEIPEEYLRTYR